jgi:hypothetical protein
MIKAVVRAETPGGVPFGRRVYDPRVAGWHP